MNLRDCFKNQIGRNDRNMNKRGEGERFKVLFWILICFWQMFNKKEQGIIVELSETVKIKGDLSK